MKIVLRHSRTGFYYCGGRDWADEAAAALVFETIREAAEAACAHQLSEIQVVIRYEFPECEFALPLAVCA